MEFFEIVRIFESNHRSRDTYLRNHNPMTLAFLNNIIPMLGTLSDPHFFDQFIPFAGIIFGCGIPIAIVCTSLYFKHRKEALWHETARIALEKGQPLPPRPDADGSLLGPVPASADAATWMRMRREARRAKDLRAGLILLALGAAFRLANQHSAGFGEGTNLASYILLGLGAAMLLNGIIATLTSGKWDGTRPPPQA
jgi:hypothetical protein